MMHRFQVVFATVLESVPDGPQFHSLEVLAEKEDEARGKVTGLVASITDLGIYINPSQYWLNVGEAAAYAGMDPSTIWEAVTKDELPGVDGKKQPRYSREMIDRWLNSRMKFIDEKKQDRRTKEAA